MAKMRLTVVKEWEISPSLYEGFEPDDFEGMAKFEQRQLDDNEIDVVDFLDDDDNPVKATIEVVKD